MRRATRKKAIRIAALIGGLAAVGLLAFIISNNSGNSRSGALYGAGTNFTGEGAAEFVAMFPEGSVTATGIQVGPNLTINSMTVTKNADGTFASNGTITIGKSIVVNANASFTDSSNWTITVASAGATPVAVGDTGISLDPSTISGSISASEGEITWNLSGSSITWPIASGASLTTQFSIGNICPLSDETECPTGDILYFGLPSGSLAISGMPTVQLSGGMALDGSWARLDGQANASASFAVAGASVSMGSPSLTIWRGARGDSYDPNMVLPDTSAITNRTNLEFCGQFGISIPSLVNKSTGGCARWTPAGIVLGQVGLGSGMSLSGGDAANGTTADVKGIGWSSLSSANISKLTLPNGGIPGAISFSGVPTPLFPSGIALGGKAELPGVVTSAIGYNGTPLSVNVTGKITADSISLDGTVPVTINFGSEPFKVSLKSLTLGLDAGGGEGLSMSLGTASDVTLGYGSSARVVHSSINLGVAVAPAPGFSLSLSAVGNPGGGDQMDGLTPSSRLAHPSAATYLVPDLFGIQGVNLWSLAGEIGWQNGTPQFSIGTTTYINPAGNSTKSVMACTETCDDTDWMIGNLMLDASVANPCFAYSFDGNSGGGSIAIDGGVMTASRFQIGISPNGCSLQSGGTTVSLPKGFAGFAFDASFGSATVSVATQVSESGFEFNTQIANIALGGFNLKSMALDVSITPTASNTSFDAIMAFGQDGSDSSTSTPLMSLALHADMGTNSSGMTWNVSADICTDTKDSTGKYLYCDPAAIAGGLGTQSTGPSSSEPARNSSGNTTTSTTQKTGFKIVQMHFQQQGNVSSCSSLSGAASGYLTMSKTTYQLLGPVAATTTQAAFPGSSFAIDCNGIKKIDFGITFTHKSSYLNGSATKTLIISWDAAEKTLNGSYSVAMTRHGRVNAPFGYSDYTFDAYFSIVVDVTISPSGASFAMTGVIDMGRVNGTLNFYLNTGGDFVGSVRISVDTRWSSSNTHIQWDGF